MLKILSFDHGMTVSLFLDCLNDTFLSKNHSRIDIVFDLYLDASIKEEERLRRSKDKAIEVNISSYHQVSYFDRGGSRKMSPPYLCE